MKRLSKILAVLFVAILAVSIFAFAAEEAEEEKTYIVYPKETVSLFSARDESPEYMVIGEEELNMLLEEGLVESYRETINGVLLGDAEEIIDYNWDIEEVKAFTAHEQGYTGEEIKIGIIDSGVDRCHPNFWAVDSIGKYTRVVPGYNYISETPDPVVSKYDCTSDAVDVPTMATQDIFGHGTSVAGKAAGWIVPTASGGWGVSGTAPKATIVPLKVTNAEKVNEAPVIDAIKGAVDDFHCDVINISIGFPKGSPELKAAIDYAVGKGVTVVAAVGNDGTDELMYPAAYDNVIGVGATDKDGKVWSDGEGGSQQNKSVFITAPGAGVVTTWSYDAPVVGEDGEVIVGEDEKPKKYDFVETEGTSVAAPLVTGTVALLKQAKPALEPDDIRNILANSATDDVKGDGYDTAYGYGILDVEKAIQLALETDANLAPVDISYIVNAKESALSNAITVENYTPGNIGSHPLGASFTATAEPTYITEDGTTYKFAYWANGNGTHVSGDATYKFNAASNFSLYAVYDEVVTNETESTEKKVEFWNGNGILLGAANADTEGKVASSAIPENPEMTGYVFAGWIDEDKKAFSAESVLEKNFTRVVALFTDGEEKYSITFNDATDTDTKETGAYGEKVEYTANEKDFDYWELDGKIVSYDPTIEIALWGTEKKLAAVYEEENVTAKPTVVLDEGADGADFLIYAVPENYEIVDAGIVFGETGENPRVASFRSKASVKKIPADRFGQFTSLPGDASHTVARGYLIYKDLSGVTRVIYADK